MPEPKEKEGAEKPWFGKRCNQCDAPINYAYKGIVEGFCGKCTDEIRKKFKIDLREEILLETLPGYKGKISLPGSRFVPGIVLGFILGACLAFAGAVALDLHASDTWRLIVDKARTATGR